MKGFYADYPDNFAATFSGLFKQQSAILYKKVSMYNNRAD